MTNTDKIPEPLNRLIGDNVEAAYAEARKRAQKKGQKPPTWHSIATAMARIMERKSGEPYPVDTVVRTMRAYRKNPNERYWRVDYLDAFSEVVGVSSDARTAPSLQSTPTIRVIVSTQN